MDITRITSQETTMTTTTDMADQMADARDTQAAILYDTESRVDDLEQKLRQMKYEQRSQQLALDLIGSYGTAVLDGTKRSGIITACLFSGTRRRKSSSIAHFTTTVQDRDDRDAQWTGSTDKIATYKVQPRGQLFNFDHS